MTDRRWRAERAPDNVAEMPCAVCGQMRRPALLLTPPVWGDADGTRGVCPAHAGGIEDGQMVDLEALAQRHGTEGAG